MSFNKIETYLNTPAGDTILVEIFEERGNITILVGEGNRIDLDAESAFELADSLLILASETGETEDDE